MKTYMNTKTQHNWRERKWKQGRWGERGATIGMMVNRLPTVITLHVTTFSFLPPYQLVSNSKVITSVLNIRNYQKQILLFYHIKSVFF